jgi:hypothetical protein
MKNLLHVWQFMLLSCLLLGGLSSCGSDEPQVESIDYYLEVEEEFLVNGAVNRTDRYKEHNPKTMMMEAIRNVYPKPDNVGKDDAVIQACDQVYTRFYEMYTGNDDHLTALFHLVKAHKVGDIVKRTEYLKTYNIDVNPIEPETGQ